MRKWIAVSTWLVCLGAWAEPPAAAGQLYEDGKGHLLLLPASRAELNDLIRFGDAAALHELPIIGSRGGDGVDQWIFWEPRALEPSTTLVERNAQGVRITCDERSAPLLPVSSERQAQLLAKAALLPRKWDRQPHALARDERGIYYFVDRLRAEGPGRDFRVFVGPKGGLKPLKMTNVVADSEGDIFITRRGELRLVLDRSEAVWVSGKRRTQLKALPLLENRRLIYNELGPYAAVPLGTPCDVL
jgi:hypothetical protein